MKNIPENIQLLGLVVNTIPFTYENETVSANYSGYITKEDLLKIKAELEKIKNHETISDLEKITLSDEIYFIDKIIEKLGV